MINFVFIISTYRNKTVFLARLLSSILIILSILTINGCSDFKRKFDDSDSADIADFYDKPKKNNKINKKKDKSSPDAKNSDKNIPQITVPKLSRIITVAPPPKIGGEKIISFSTTEQVQLKDALIELARVAKIDIDIDKKISGGIILNAKNRPLNEVLDRIASLGKLRYSYRNGVLFFEKDRPFHRNYTVNFVQNEDLWSSVEEGINSILDKTNKENAESSVDNAGSGDGSEGDGASAGNASVSNDEGGGNAETDLKINKTAGIITIYANQKQHAIIKQYLDDVLKNSSAQVLIEAKVMEVRLSDKFVAGVDWNLLNDYANRTTNNYSLFNGDTSPGFSINSIKTSIFGGDLSIAINFLNNFGVAKAISSPRINVMNNQEASLDFSKKFIYFTVSVTQSTESGVNNNSGNALNTSTINSTKNEQAVGIELKMTPSINFNKNEVTLTIEPKISDRSSDAAVLDPAINPKTGLSLGNKIPIFETKQLKTTAKITSGNVLVLGGLLKQNNETKEQGIPILSNIPILGYLFKHKSKESTVTETVIFIKATIIDDNNPLRKYDRDLHQKISNDKSNFMN